MPDVAMPRPTSRPFALRRRGHWLFPLLAVWMVSCTTRVSADDPGLQSAPLAARSRPTGATLFTPVSPEQSGIVAMNHYADPAMWAERYQELAYGAMGTGVTAGDYDNDGRPDVFIVSKTGQSRLFRNLGDWKFENVTERAGLAGEETAGVTGLIKGWLGGDTAGTDANPYWSQGACFADVNNDGWLDLYVCRFGAANRLYVNRGDGTFAEEAAVRGLAVVDASGMAAFCDYDRDGWLDVYVQTSLLDAGKHPRGQRDHLFRNRGDGTFVDVTATAGIGGEAMGHSATWWDHDQDGWPDLYVGSDYDAPDQLYRNNRDGTFTDVLAATVPHTAYYAMGSDFGDVDNDGLTDLLVTDMAAISRTKDLRGMAVSRARTQAQLDSDGAAPTAQIMRNVLFRNTGVGRMQEAACMAGFPATDWSWSPRFEDLDNDGLLDLHVTNGMSREYHNVDLLDRIVAIEDLNGSRRLMKAASPLAERNLAYRNLGELRFEEVGPAWGLDQNGVSFGAAFADFDGDGDLDVVFANYEAPPTVLRNDSLTGHRVIFSLRGTSSNRFGAGTWVRLETAAGVQVRQLVLARGYLSSSEPILHFGLGDQDSVKNVTVEWPSGHVQTFADLAADRRYVITEPTGAAKPATAAPAERGQFTEESRSRGLSLASRESFQAEQQPLVPVRFDRRGPALVVADLNGDRRDDVVLGGTSTQPAEVHLGGASFSSGARLPVSPLDDGPLLAFDADGDGDRDLLQTRASTVRRAGAVEYQPVLHVNDGAGGFQPTADALPPLPISVGAAIAADFDRDGRLDLFLGARVQPGRYPSAPRSALLLNRGGRFEDVTDALAAGLAGRGMVTSALASDVDQDGWPDLVLALEWGGVEYWRNDQGRGFSDESKVAGFAAAGTGWWTSLAGADFNGDGRFDYVAGNVGLNTPYRAPALLFSGRFSTGAQTQLVEAVEEAGRLRTLRSRNELMAVMPALAKRFPRNDAFAQASLEEILGADRLKLAQRFEATELQSGVFLSQPDGTYRFEPLPRIAQIAPLQGIVTGDFDGDGHADIYAAQNSYAVDPAVGRFDGGLSQLLLGDGRGRFVAATPRASGLVMPGDAKALVVLDLDADGWPDFLVSRNHATTLAWRNAGIAGRRSFRVLLEGPAGNPDAVGAQLTLELADGASQRYELHAGSGYYSQSAAGCFFGHPEANPPKRLRVRWPDGVVTEHAVDPSATAMTIRR
jgi:hypothetical protein